MWLISDSSSTLMSKPRWTCEIQNCNRGFSKQFGKKVTEFSRPVRSKAEKSWPLFTGKQQSPNFCHLFSLYSSCTTLLSRYLLITQSLWLIPAQFHQKHFRQKKKTKMAACYIFIRTPYSAEPKNSHSSRSVFFSGRNRSINEVFVVISVCVCLWRIAPLNCPAPLEKNWHFRQSCRAKMSYNWRNASHGCVIFTTSAVPIAL